MIRFISESPTATTALDSLVMIVALDFKENILHASKPLIRHAWNIGIMANFFGMVLIDVIFLSIKENHFDLSVKNSQGLYFCRYLEDCNELPDIQTIFTQFSVRELPPKNYTRSDLTSLSPNFKNKYTYILVLSRLKVKTRPGLVD